MLKTLNQKEEKKSQQSVWLRVCVEVCSVTGKDQSKPGLKPRLPLLSLQDRASPHPDWPRGERTKILLIIN